MSEALIPEDYDPQAPYAESEQGEALQPVKASPSEALLNRLKTLSLPKISYQWFFWGLITPGAALVLLAGMMARPQMATLDTPASTDFKAMELEQAIAIVVGQPLKAPDGKEFFVSDPSQKLVAAQKVLQWQEGELIATKATYLALNMARGAATPNHLCYQKPQIECVARIRQINDEQRQNASKKQDLDGLLLASQLDRALDRVATGDLSPSKYQADLHLMAIAKYRAAITEQNAASPNGQAAQILRDVQKEAQQKP